MYYGRLLLAILALCGTQVVEAQSPPVPAPTADQLRLLQSPDPILARNKRVAYDLWRTTISAGHVELTPEYMDENFHDNNPGVPPGRKGYMDILSKALKPIPIQPTIKGLLDVLAEDDRVVLVFENEWSDAARAGPRQNEPNSFEMFRVRDGKVVEHWDSMPRAPKRPEGAGAPSGAPAPEGVSAGPNPGPN